MPSHSQDKDIYLQRMQKVSKNQSLAHCQWVTLSNFTARLNYQVTQSTSKTQITRSVHCVYLNLLTLDQERKIANLMYKINIIA